MEAVLTIAGSDCSGGAGIQADIKTMLCHGVYAMSAITALTAQNTVGVLSVMEVSPDFLDQQLEAVFTDIYPRAVKVGMVSSEALIEVIVKKLQKYKVDYLVVDPVMIATSGAHLIKDGGINKLKEGLLPLANLITPNIPEAEILSGITINHSEDMLKATKYIGDTYHCNVLCKGGHRQDNADDLLYHKGVYTWLRGERINNPNTHGTGCTLSSAIASNLAKGNSLLEAVEEAKSYITGALIAGLDLGKGSGPMDHGYRNKV